MIRQEIKDIEVWAADGYRSTPAALGMAEADGWPLSAEQVGGTNVSRGMMNELLHRLTSAFASFRDSGCPPEWDAAVDYIHDASGIAFVRGSDGGIYRSVQASGPATGNATDPTRDSANTYWSAY